MNVLSKFALFPMLTLLIATGLPLSAGEKAHGQKVDQRSHFAVLHELEAGNARFVSGATLYKPNLEERKELANGQKPHTIVLSCSDSRVPPELIFDQGLGELFTVRVAGNVVDEHVLASIEYAVEHLGSQFLVIMGHESCGAVKAALTTPKGKSAGSPSLDELVGEIQSNLNGNTRFVDEDPRLHEPVKANVIAVAQQLVHESPIIQEAIEHGQLMLAQGIYSLTSGEVEFWYVGRPELTQASASTKGNGHASSTTSSKAVISKKETPKSKKSTPKTVH